MGWQGGVTCRSDGHRNSTLPATGAGDDRDVDCRFVGLPDRSTHAVKGTLATK